MNRYKERFLVSVCRLHEFVLRQRADVELTKSRVVPNQPAELLLHKVKYPGDCCDEHKRYDQPSGENAREAAAALCSTRPVGAVLIRFAYLGDFSVRESHDASLQS